MKRILLPLLLFSLAALSYISAPLAAAIIARILEPDYIRADVGARR